MVRLFSAFLSVLKDEYTYDGAAAHRTGRQAGLGLGDGMGVELLEWVECAW